MGNKLTCCNSNEDADPNGSQTVNVNPIAGPWGARLIRLCVFDVILLVLT